jgi:hypothetical protein
MSIQDRARRTPPLPIIDPVEEARALAYHLGREEAGGQRPTIPVLEAVDELRTAEVEHIMSEVPA